MDGGLRVRVLIVEDSGSDALLMQRALQKSIPGVESRHVETMDEVLPALHAERWDVVLCDYAMPRVDVDMIVSAVAQAAPSLSTILVSGAVGEEAVADLMRRGLADVVLKDRIAVRLAPVVMREVSRSRERRASAAIQQHVETILLASDTATDWQEAAQLVLRHLGSRLGALLAVMWEPIGAAGILQPIASWSPQDWVRQEFPENQALLDLTRAHLARSIAEGKPLVERRLADIFRAPSVRMPAQAREGCGIVSLISQPFTVGGQAFGLSMMFGEDVRAVDSLLVDINAISLTLQVPLFRKRVEFERRLLLHALDALGSGVIITDATVDPPGPRIIYINNGFANLYGYETHEMIGATPRMLQGSGTDKGSVAIIREALLAGQPCRTELVNYGKDGEPFLVDLDITPVRSEGTITHFVAIQRNITDSRRAEQDRQQREIAFHTAEAQAALELQAAKSRAEKAESFLRDAIDSMSEGFIIYDQEDRFVMCNKAYRDLYQEGSSILVPGVRFDTVTVHMREVMGGAFANEPVEAFGNTVEERLLRHQSAEGVPEYRLNNGTWIRLTDRRMKNGGVACLRMDITPLKEAQAALLQSQQHFRQIAESISEMFWLWSLTDRRLLFINAAYEKIYGRTREELERDPAQWLGAIHEDDRDRVVGALFSGRPHPTSHIEYRVVRPDGEIRWLLACIYPGLDGDDASSFVAGVAEDVTIRRQLEQQVLQSQKMEALGNLTGGMAHDFNNILGIIIGNLELLKRHVAGDSLATELCSEAIGGALTGSGMIHDLLAFARRQSLNTRKIDLNAFIQSKQPLLARILGAPSRLICELAGDLWLTAADVAQLESALINLVANARDAMQTGGTLTITTSNVSMAISDCIVNTEMMPGDYVLIEIQDTGTGVAPGVIGKIFEPFFTTKRAGSGTGLGLAMVYGFVKQSGGMISVASELGYGTTFRIHLPRAFGDAEYEILVEAPTEAEGGLETILVVEDNAHLRSAVLSQLADLGYRTVSAANASDALSILATGRTVDLLFTDIVMPGGLDGIELALQAKLIRPQLRVLLTSGFPDVHDADTRMNTAGFTFIAKPYRRNDLAATLRFSLDAHQGRLAVAHLN